MHSLTTTDLATLAQWTNDVVRADKFAIELQKRLPERQDVGPYGNMTSSFGTLMLTVYQAESVRAVMPYLRAARAAGFKRVGAPVQDAENNRVSWRYEAEDDGITVLLYIHLNFLESENAACRYVTVGEKTVPDKRLLCGEELAAWEANNGN